MLAVLVGSEPETMVRKAMVRALAVVTALGASAAVATPAQAKVKLVRPGGKSLEGRWQSWADASRVPTVRGRVTVRRRACPALPKAAGCVYPRKPRVIWLRPGAGDPRGALLHELGHVFDLIVMNRADRAKVKRIFDSPSRRAWWRGRQPLAEWFAEGYSWCARYRQIRSLRRYASYRYDPTPRQHAKLCQVIRRAAADRRPPQPAPAPPVTQSVGEPPPPPSDEPDTIPGDPAHDPGPVPIEDPNLPPPPVPPLPAAPPLSTP
jgi:hypothetical protein